MAGRIRDELTLDIEVGRGDRTIESPVRELVGRRTFLGGATGALVLIRSSLAGANESAIRPESFGAKGDGITNDTAALAAMADFVNARGGGVVEFRRGTYVIGSQSRGIGRRNGYAFEPAKVMEFAGCTAPLIVRGNGARIRCASGLRFGTFDPVTGRATRNATPYYRTGELSTPYRWMIKAERCAGLVEISDLELDGNLPGMVIGGPWGDRGHQLPALGLGLYENIGPELVRNVHSHHHPLDGITIDGADRERGAESMLEGVHCEGNGRQGCSIVGGRSYSFRGCSFNRTGKAGLASSPGAGVDIEAEAGKKIRNIAFTACEFSDNFGPGMVADQGDSEGVQFSDCTFVGTTSWSAWPNKAGMRFVDCRFVGPIVNAFGDRAHAERAAQFSRCSFLDDPLLTPTRHVYIPTNTAGPIADLSDNPNVIFRQCRFRLIDQSVLPWTTNVVTFADCTMSQRSPKVSYPRGKFVGRNTIVGHVDLYSAIVAGELIVNGQLVRRGPVV